MVGLGVVQLPASLARRLAAGALVADGRKPGQVLGLRHDGRLEGAEFLIAPVKTALDVDDVGGEVATSRSAS